jgi:hypothetical protein
MNADEKRRKRGLLTLWVAAGLAVATALLPGALAVVCGVLSGLATVAGLTAAFAHELGIDGGRQAPRSQEAATVPPVEPHQAVRLHVDAPPTVRRWLERVEHTAEAEAARRGR